MPDRFYHPGPWNELIELAGAEAQHLAKVLRGAPGDQIELFDGAGRSLLARIEQVTKRSVQVRGAAAFEMTPEPAPEIILAVASPKGERLKWMIEKGTELGVDRLIPLETERGVVHPSDHKWNKLEQTVIAACKQSGRDRFLKIDEPCPLPALKARLEPAQTQFFVGDPAGSPTVSYEAGSDRGNNPLVAVIGPEGGLTDAERELLNSWSAVPVCLSPHVLRIETAALAAAVCLVGLRFRINS